MFTPDTLKFLKELEANNNKPWFDANKKRFQESVQEPAAGQDQQASHRRR